MKIRIRQIGVFLSIALLCGCIAEPRVMEPAQNPEPRSSGLYPDVKVTRVLRVIDGDTFACDIDEHSAIAGKNISIRVQGIDTPELRSKDPARREAAQREKVRLAELLNHAEVIELRRLKRDKYFRIDADVYLDGERLLPKLNPEYLTEGERP